MPSLEFRLVLHEAVINLKIVYIHHSGSNHPATGNIVLKIPADVSLHHPEPDKGMILSAEDKHQQNNN